MLSQTFFISVFNRVRDKSCTHGPNIRRYWPVQWKTADIWPMCTAASSASVEGSWLKKVCWLTSDHRHVVAGPAGLNEKKKPQCVLGFRQFYCYLAPHRRVSPLVLVDHRHQKGWAQPCWDPSLNQLEQACRSAYPTEAHIQATYDWCSTEQFPGWFTQVGSD